jgi:hypothetical protein
LHETIPTLFESFPTEATTILLETKERQHFGLIHRFSFDSGSVHFSKVVGSSKDAAIALCDRMQLYAMKHFVDQ